ncbi:hypothetical protein EVS87_007175 [Bacillus altitudinis]|nr:hypothetical protein [Bacillus aerophilus]MDF9416943.1 hypothetical protein [Bacillus altitudinis]MXP80599.1 hypothetical protein [Bacillus sp. AN2]MBX7014377.1 hypothetical protein [Bacillus aerophilus]NEU54353.1 hypothetical protein [Bacillus altitudinis]
MKKKTGRQAFFFCQKCLRIKMRA